jgi:hypothetical protein
MFPKKKPNNNKNSDDTSKAKPVKFEFPPN